MNYRVFLIAATAASAFALAGCASSGGNKVAKNANQSNHPHMVCESEAPLGSHIAHETCMTETQYKAQQKANERSAQQFQDQVQDSPTSQNNNAGGPPSRR